MKKSAKIRENKISDFFGRKILVFSEFSEILNGQNSTKGMFLSGQNITSKCPNISLIFGIFRILIQKNLTLSHINIFASQQNFYFKKVG